MMLSTKKATKNNKSWCQSQQKQLSSLQHAAACELEAADCSHPFHSEAVRKLLTHVVTCRDDRCWVTHCQSSRCLLSHYSRCRTSENDHRECPICSPIRASEIYASDKVAAASRAYKRELDEREAYRAELEDYRAELDRREKSLVFQFCGWWCSKRLEEPKSTDGQEEELFGRFKRCKKDLKALKVFKEKAENVEGIVETGKTNFIRIVEESMDVQLPEHVVDMIVSFLPKVLPLYLLPLSPGDLRIPSAYRRSRDRFLMRDDFHPTLQCQNLRDLIGRTPVVIFTNGPLGELSVNCRENESGYESEHSYWSDQRGNCVDIRTVVGWKSYVVPYVEIRECQEEQRVQLVESGMCEIEKAGGLVPEAPPFLYETLEAERSLRSFGGADCSCWERSYTA